MCYTAKLDGHYVDTPYVYSCDHYSQLYVMHWLLYSIYA